MNRLAEPLLMVIAVAAFCSAIRYASAQDEETQCIACHGTPDLWEGETLRLYVAPERMAEDVHTPKGIQCHDCHGGNPNTFELREAHALEDGFRKLETPQDVVAFCGRCHSDAEYMHKFRPDASTDLVDRFWTSAHGLRLKQPDGSAAATCTSCHKPHAMQRADVPNSNLHPSRLSETCGECHKQALVDLRKSVHHKAGPKDERGAGLLMDCSQCHGADIHGLLPTDHPDSPVYLDNQVERCGECHKEYLASYELGIHGQGLRKSGLTVTAVCSDCHGAHGIYYAADLRSTLHAANVAATCGACHHFLEERLNQSVHGEAFAREGPSRHTTRSGQRKPSCTDCHQGHDALDPESPEFRFGLLNRCGNCHPNLSQRYRLSLHGQLTELGYLPAATCSDCHGPHDILPVNHPQSHLSVANRVETCRKCHPKANENFAQFDPHADDHDPVNYPLLYHVRTKVGTALGLGVGLFLVHGVFWFTRAFAHTRRFGSDRLLVAETPAVMRLVPTQRTAYFLLLSSFLGLAWTGLPLKFSHFGWAQRVAAGLGGFSTISMWHHFFGVVLICAALIHVVNGIRRWLAARPGARPALFGPDSPLPNRRDVRDVRKMLRWFVGLGRRPKFENWTYWEKLDYWATGAGILIVATSGLMLWLPHWFMLFLTGSVLNLAKTVHVELALSIGGFILLIHIFNTHLRPGKFPLDATLFTGLTSETHLRAARPEYLERMQREGRLDEIVTVTPGQEQLRPAIWSGAVLLLIGGALLVAILLAVLSK